MGAEASILARLLTRYGAAAGRELAPTAMRMAPETIETVSRPVLEDIMSKAGGWLDELLGRGVRGAAPEATVAAPKPTMPSAPSPEAPAPLKLLRKVQQYGGYGRQYGVATGGDVGVAPNPFSRPAPEPAPGPAYQPSATLGELSYPPQGAERQEMAGRLSDLLSTLARKRTFEGRQEMMPGLQRLKAVLQEPGESTPEVTAVLNRLRGIQEPEIPPYEGEVTKIPYRGQTWRERSGSQERSFMEMGLKRAGLTPEMQTFVQDLISSGQLPADVLEQKSALQKLYGSLYGYKPKMLSGSAQEIAEAEGQGPGSRFLQQFSQMSPQEIIEYLGRGAQSGFLPKASKLAQMIEKAQEAAGQYRALGETTPASELVPQLLRGKLPASSEFWDKVLRPVEKRREKLALGPGQPLSEEELLGALRTSRFLRPSQPSPTREAFIQRVLGMLQRRKPPVYGGQ